MVKITKKDLIAKSKGKNKIFWDKAIFSAEEYRNKLIDYSTSSSHISIDYGGEEKGVCAFYFAIMNNTPKMIEQIKNRIKTQVLARSSFNRGVDERVLKKRKNAEIYMIASPSNIYLNFWKIYNGLWMKDERLHFKKDEALENLIREMEFRKI